MLMTNRRLQLRKGEGSASEAEQEAFVRTVAGFHFIGMGKGGDSFSPPA